MMFVDEGSSASSNDVHVADAWQEWAVTFKNGHTATFQSDQATPIGVNPLDVAQGNGEPSVLHITFKQQLTVQLPWVSSGIAGVTLGSEIAILKVDPIMTVMLDGRAADAKSTFQSITFDSRDSIGTVRSWDAWIIFQGGSGAAPSGAIVSDLSGATVGKSKVLVQVVMSQLWQEYTAVWAVGGYPLTETMKQIDRRTYASPYGLNFDWTPSATGTAQYTWPTAAITTDTKGNIIQVWSQTGTQVITLWKSVTATVAGPTKPVTQTIGINPNSGSNYQPGSTGACKLAGFTVPDWLCGTTFGLQNWLLLLLLAALVLIVIGASSRRND